MHGTLKIVPTKHLTAALRTVTPLSLGYGSSSIEIPIVREVSSHFFFLIAKIDAQEPLKWRNLLRKMMDTYSVAKGWKGYKRHSLRLVTKHAYIIF